MKRTAILTVFVLCAAFLMCSCGPGDTGVSPPPGDVTPVPPSDGPDGVGKLPDYAITYIPYENVCSLSAPPVPYRPEAEVFPLINTPVIYKDCIDGPLLFADKDGNLITLPEEAENYYALFQSDLDDNMNTSSIPQCILLVDRDRKVAVMLLDGTLTTGFDYTLYWDPNGADYPYLFIREGYLIVTEFDGQDKPLFGLLDVRTGELSIPCGYDYMSLCNGAVYAERGGESMLLDYNGAVAAHFGSRSLYEGVVYMEYPDVLLSGFPGDSFVIINGARGVDVYRTKHDADVTLYAAGGVNMLVRRPHQVGSEITVTDGGGNILFAVRGDGYPPHFWISGDGFVIKHDGMLTAVTQKGERSDFKYDAGEDYLENARYRNGRIYATFMHDDYYTEELRIISPDGQYTSETSRRDPQTGYYRYRENGGDYEAAFAGDDGEIVIPYGLYREFYALDSESRDFILAYTDWETSPEDIYSRGGELIAQGLYGVIDELYTPERLIVYFAPDECGFLSSDGGFTPISGVPPMEKRYYGG